VGYPLEYPEAIARFYDVIYTQLRTVDRDYFLKRISEARGPVLEIGVGTGRLFLEALSRGADIDGIDNSSHMLARLKQKLDRKHESRIFLQDIRSMQLPRTYDLTILHHGIKDQVDFVEEYEPGKKLTRTVSAKAKLVDQINLVTMTLAWDEEGGERTETWQTPLRFFFRYELEHLVNRSKLRLKHVYGDYQEHELGPGSTDFIVVCERSE